MKETDTNKSEMTGDCHETERYVSPHQAVHDLSLALIYLTRFTENKSILPVESGVTEFKSWKSHNWETLEQLIDEDYIRDGHGGKSLWLTRTGVDKAKEVLSQYGIQDWETTRKRSITTQKHKNHTRRWNDRIGKAYIILKKGLYSLAVYKVLKNRFIENGYELDRHNFWINVSDNALQMAAIQWCKVFGSEENEVYYKKLVDEERFFRKIPELTFDEIVHDIQLFRNRYVAHNGKYHDPIPYFNRALKVIRAFENAVHEEYDLLSEPPNLCIMYDGYCECIIAYLNDVKIKDV